jgi:hypothetical protein
VRQCTPAPPTCQTRGKAVRRHGVLDHETHEKIRKARKVFVAFAFFRDFRGPNTPLHSALTLLPPFRPLRSARQYALRLRSAMDSSRLNRASRSCVWNDRRASTVPRPLRHFSPHSALHLDQDVVKSGGTRPHPGASPFSFPACNYFNNVTSTLNRSKPPSRGRPMGEFPCRPAPETYTQFGAWVGKDTDSRI